MNKAAAVCFACQTSGEAWPVAPFISIFKHLAYLLPYTGVYWFLCLPLSLRLSLPLTINFVDGHVVEDNHQLRFRFTSYVIVYDLRVIKVSSVLFFQQYIFAHLF